MQKYYFNTITKFSLILLSITVLSSCVKDITQEELTLILPTNGQTYTTNQVHFKWKEVENAKGYRIEIVKPSFESIQEFVLDSVVEGTQFYQILSPGQYEFQIRAENSAYETAYVGPYSITLDSVSDLSTQQVGLLSPVDNYATNELSLDCEWDVHYAADYYQFQLRSGLDFSGSVSVPHNQSEIYSTSYSIPSGILNEGEYSWGVRAHNQNSFSDYSAHSFIVDMTAPNDVDLIEPIDNATTPGQTFTFKWDSGIDPGQVNSNLFSKIEIYTDENLNSLYHEESNIYGDSLEITISAGGDYWWQVYQLDEAGNQSQNYSTVFKVTVP